MQQNPSPATEYVAALPDPEESDNVAYNPSMDELRASSQALETTTVFDAPAYVSRERSRNGRHTKNLIDHQFEDADYELVRDSIATLEGKQLICLDRQMGRHPDTTYVCRYYVPRAYSRIALGVAQLFEPVKPESEPDFQTVQLPDWDDLAIRVFPDAGFTTVLGSDYTGEAKKSFLRLFMYSAKQQGGIGLHAGSKQVELETGDGLETVGQLFLGLSGTGKSTLTAHGLWLDAPEHAAMLQDDVCALLPDGTVAGSEGRGLFVKTHGLDNETEPGIYDAATDESAILENVDVDDNGTVDFDSDRYTTNGRAIIQRDRLSSAAGVIDLPEVDQIFFITRNPVMPPVAKLTPEEAAVAFMLGESIQTSAGDPSAAGEPVRVVGTNPFIIGSEGKEGNRFRELIADLDTDCFLLNTGSVGSVDIGVEETVTLLRAITRDAVEWEDDELTGLRIPTAVPGSDLDKYDVATAMSDPQSRLEELRDDRDRYLAQFDDLDPAILSARY